MSDDWSEKPPPEGVYADKVECHWCGHKLSQHSKEGDRPCLACHKCQRYMARSTSMGVNLPSRVVGWRVGELVNRLLEATESCEWPLGWKQYAKASHFGPAEYDMVLCEKRPIGHDKNGIPYCKEHVPADHDRDTVPEEPEKD